MCWKCHIEVLLAYADRNSALLISLVAGDDDIFLVRTLEHDDRHSLGLLAWDIAMHLAARSDEIREMFYSVELRSIAERTTV